MWRVGAPTLAVHTSADERERLDAAGLSAERGRGCAIPAQSSRSTRVTANFSAIDSLSVPGPYGASS